MELDRNEENEQPLHSSGCFKRVRECLAFPSKSLPQYDHHILHLISDLQNLFILFLFNYAEVDDVVDSDEDEQPLRSSGCHKRVRDGF